MKKDWMIMITSLTCLLSLGACGNDEELSEEESADVYTLVL